MNSRLGLLEKMLEKLSFFALQKLKKKGQHNFKRYGACKGLTIKAEHDLHKNLLILRIRTLRSSKRPG